MDGAVPAISPDHAQQTRVLHAASPTSFFPRLRRWCTSTCSLDPRKRQCDQRIFVGRAGGPFKIGPRVSLGRPWVAGHDGAGVFLLEKTL